MRDNIHRNIEYAVFCPNYLDCDGLVDYGLIMARKSDFIAHIKEIGWRKFYDEWYCPDCIGKIQASTEKPAMSPSRWGKA